MNAEAYVQAVREDLANVAAVGGDATALAAELLTTALEPSLGRRFQEALVEAALELSAQLERGRVEVRVAGDELDLVYVESAESQSAEAADEAISARVTLRLADSLKARVEAAAAARSMSVNTWLVQTVSRALDPPPPHGGVVSRHRMTGYGRS
jgi:HicB family